MIVRLKNIKLKELKPYISLAFRNDNTLFEKYNRFAATHEECVEHTFLNILGGKKLGIECYAIVGEDGDECHIIGYAVILPYIQTLFSFGINKEYRNESIHTQWLALIGKVFGKFWMVTLWIKNLRAIRFFEAHGFSHKMEQVYNKEKTITLWQ